MTTAILSLLAILFTQKWCRFGKCTDTSSRGGGAISRSESKKSLCMRRIGQCSAALCARQRRVHATLKVTMKFNAQLIYIGVAGAEEATKVPDSRLLSPLSRIHHSFLLPNESLLGECYGMKESAALHTAHQFDLNVTQACSFVAFAEQQDWNVIDDDAALFATCVWTLLHF